MSPAIEYKRVRRDDSLSVAYLKLIYSTIYPELFPDADIRERWEQWIEHLDHGTDEYFFIIAGSDLCDPGLAVLHGFTVGTYSSESKTALMCYIGVDKTCRASGVATGLLNALTAEIDRYAQTHDNAELRGLFAEAYDPAEVTADHDSLPPAVRLKIYHRWKALQVPVKYMFPSLHTPWRKNGKMVLLSLPVYGHYAEPDDVLGRIADEYIAAGLIPENDADFCRIRMEIQNWRGYISLAPYDPPKQAEEKRDSHYA